MFYKAPARGSFAEGFVEREREMAQMLSLNMVLQGYCIFSRFYGFEISKFGHFSFHQCSSSQCIVVRRHLKAY